MDFGSQWQNKAEQTKFCIFSSKYNTSVLELVFIKIEVLLMVGTVQFQAAYTIGYLQKLALNIVWADKEGIRWIVDNESKFKVKLIKIKTRKSQSSRICITRLNFDSDISVWWSSSGDFASEITSASICFFKYNQKSYHFTKHLSN